ncbi:MAG TPA: TMEM165/GDT1 family protein [Chloroflexia bacterium]|nr:TMEM165/GDT1 family protein [Chloroflexia bacterium]
MNLALIFSIFGFIFVAELPDKTALASLVLATRYKPLVVFTGAAAAFVVQSLVAISVGSLVSLLPQELVHRLAGLLFLIFAFFMWRRNQEDEEHRLGEEVNTTSFLKGSWAAFLVVFIAEWGDLTQLATATLEAKYRDPLSVFLGATLALWAVAALAIVIGNRANTFLNPRITQKIAAIIFALLGIVLLIGLI